MCTHTQMRVFVYVCVCARMYVHVHVCVYVQSCVPARVFDCMCILGGDAVILEYADTLTRHNPEHFQVCPPTPPFLPPGLDTPADNNMHTQTHIRMHTCTHMHKHTQYTHTHIRAVVVRAQMAEILAHTHTHTHQRTHTRTNIYKHTHTGTYIHVNTHIQVQL